MRSFYLNDSDRGIDPNAAYDRSITQMGNFNTFGLSDYYSSSTGKYDIRQDEPRYAYDGDSIIEELNLSQVTNAADQLKQYGDDLFAIFDRYQGNYDYLADNAGVSDAELQNRLGLSGSEFQASADAQDQEYQREMRRMGVNPNSAKFAGFGTSNALQKAAGLSMTQNQVRQDARDESWKENMEVAQFGLNAGNSGAGAVATASSAYDLAGQKFSDNKIKYASLNENARQFDNQYALQQDQLKLSAQNQAFTQGAERFQNGMMQTIRNPWQSNQSISYDYGY